MDWPHLYAVKLIGDDKLLYAVVARDEDQGSLTLRLMDGVRYQLR